MGGRRVLASLVSLVIVVSQAVWSPQPVLAASDPPPAPVEAKEPPSVDAPLPTQEESGLAILSFTPVDGQALHLLGGGGVHLRAAVRNSTPVDSIEFTYSADGSTWTPIKGEQDTGVRALTGRLAYERALLWDASSLVDGTYQIKAVALVGEKRAEQLHKITIDRKSVLPETKPAAEPPRPAPKEPRRGVRAEERVTTMRVAPVDGSEGPTAADFAGVEQMAVTSGEAIALEYIGPEQGTTFLAEAWGEADYRSAVPVTSIAIEYRLQGDEDWTPVTPTYDSGLETWDNGDGTWYSYRYVDFALSAFAQGTYELRFTATAEDGSTRVDVTTFEVGEFELDWIGPDSGNWYGPYDVDGLWIEVDYYSAHEPVSIEFQYRKAGDTNWNAFDALSYDSGFTKYDDTPWYSWRYVEWDATDWADGAYEVRYTITDTTGGTDSGIIVYNLDQTPPPAPELTVVAGADGKSFDLTWTGSPQIDQYRIERYAPYGYNHGGGDLEATAVSGEGYWTTIAYLEGTETNYSDSAVARGVQYTYRIEAEDFAENVSEPSDEVPVSLPYAGPELDYVYPDSDYRNDDWIWMEAQFRDDVPITAMTFEYSTDNLTWTPIPAEDDSGIEVNGEIYHRGFDWDMSEMPDGLYYWRVTATDANNVSNLIEMQFTLDRELAITNLTVSRHPTQGLILSWDAISDAAYYDLYAYRDGYYYSYWSPDVTASSQHDPYATIDHTYEYLLYAYDRAGNGTSAQVTYEWYGGPEITLEGARPVLTNQSTHTVVGQTEPGALVTVNGAEAVVDAEGNFTSQAVSLNEGENTLVIQASNAGGTRTVQLTVIKDSAAPTVYAYGSSPVGPSFQIAGESYDNHPVQKLIFQFYRPDSGTWATAAEVTNSSIYSGWFWAEADIDASEPLSDGQPLTGGSHLWRVQVVDAFGNVGLSSEMSIQIDLTGPAAPSDFAATAGVRYVDLSWGASADDDGRYYRIYRSTSSGGTPTLVATRDAWTWWTPWNSYRDLAVEGGTTYYYTVRVVDSVGNEGAPSAELSVTTLADTNGPVITSVYPGNNSHVAGPTPQIWVYFNDEDGELVQTATFEWSSDNGATWTPIAETYGPYRNYGNEEYAYANWQTAGLPSGTYQIRITLTDRTGNRSTSTLTYTTDFFAAVPANLVASTGHGGVVKLDWDPVPEGDHYAYEIYRSTTPGAGFGHVATVYYANTEYTDTNVQAGTSYYYQVRSVDQSSNRSAFTPEVAVLADADTIPPSVTSESVGPRIGETVGGPSINFSFLFTDNVLKAPTSAALAYSTDQGESWIPLHFYGPYQYSGTTYYIYGSLNTAGLTEGSLTFKLNVLDGAGNPLEWIRTYALDLSTEAVTNLSAYPGQNSVQLLWNPVEDSHFSYYQVLRGTTAGGPYSYVTNLWDRSATGYLHQYQTPGTTYYYVVDTFDQLGNKSRSAEVSATPQVDTTPPVITSVDPVSETAIGDSRTIYLHFTENADPRLVTGSMEYSADGTTWTSVGSMAYSDWWYQQYVYRHWDISGLADGTYQVRYTITDGSGLTDQETVTYQIDRTAPAPVTLTAAGQDVQQIRLDWTASDADVQYYRIERAAAEAGPFNHLATVGGSTLSYTDTVTPNQTYYYRVIAQDRFRSSNPSNVQSAMAVQDTEPPQITYFTPESGRKSESFYMQANASDNLGVVALRLEYSIDGVTWTEISRNANSSSISLTWENATAPEGEVQVRAVAVDAAGNSSDSRADNPVRTYQLDRTAPAPPVITATAPDEQHIQLNWSVSDADVTYVQLQWAANPAGPWNSLGSFNPSTQTYTHTVTPATMYYYRAAAHDGLRTGAFSEPLAASAVPDTQKPSVSYLNPADGLKPAVFGIQTGATDNLGVVRIALSYSLDNGASWTEFASANGNSLNHSWNTAGLIPTGSTVQVRAVAEDGAGNLSDNSPVRSYQVDNVAPAAPTHLQAVASVVHIDVAWDLPPAADGVRFFNLYRSTDGSSYSLYRSGLQATGFRDSWAEQGETYYYQATAVDLAGNESARSGAVSTSLQPDNVAPAILSINPGSGTVGANPTIWVSAQDNYRLKTISLAYRPAAGGAWTPVGTESRNGRYDGASFVWNTASLSDGSYQLRALATDQADNLSQEVLFNLTLDLTAPQAPTLSLTPGGWSIQLDWTASSAPDLYGYRVLKQRADGNWVPLGTTGALTHTDAPLDPSGTYTYAVEAVDQRGNTARSLPISAQPLTTDPYAPIAYAGPDTTVFAGSQVTFNGLGSRDNDRVASYTWSFPDSSTESGAVVSRVLAEPGTYTVQLRVTDPAGNDAFDNVTVTVRPVPVVGNLNVVVKNKATGQRLGGASVVVQVPDGDLLHFLSDGNGQINMVAPPGDYTAHAYLTGYLPNNTAITITQGGGGTYEVLLEPGEIVTGELTVERMTLDEIVEAGVDVTNPDNQWVYKFEIHLAFQQEPLPPQTVMVNYQGNVVGGGALPPIPIGGSIGGGGGGGLGPSYIAYPTIIPSPRPEVEPTIAYLVIPGKASFLKEFFKVELRLMNHAAEQYVIDNAKATLNLPEGVALAPTAVPQSLTVDLAQLAGQEEEVVEWVIRGDAEGDYHLSADFTGILLPFGDPVSGHFTTVEPFHVWGPSAVKLIVEPQATATKGAPYHLRLTMENVTDEPLPGGRLDPAHVYNAAIELLEGGKQNFIYAPNQQLLQMKTDLGPGETFSADFYLIPCISGNLVLNQSYVLRTGGNAEFVTDLRPGHAAPYAGLPLSVERNGAQVTLTWAAAGGAVTYRIYTVRPDLYMSVATDRVGEVSTTSITLTESGGPQSYIVTVVDAVGAESLQHMVSDTNWCEGAAQAVVTVDPEQVVVGQATEVLITANAGGFPVSHGTVSVGSYATDLALNANGQATVTLTATAPGPIDVILTVDGVVVAQTVITAVEATDSVAPSTVADVDADGLGSWYLEPATVVLTAADNEGGSGVAEIHYSLDGTTYTLYQGPILIDLEGEQTLYYYAVDVAGNAEEPKEREINLDLNPPVTTASLVNNLLTLSATDTGSGVASTEYSLDGGQSWTPYTGPLSVPVGATVHYRSKDQVNQTEVARSIRNAVSAVRFQGDLGSGQTVELAATERLPIGFTWEPNGTPTLNKSATVRVRDAVTNRVITSFVVNLGMSYDPATGLYQSTFDPAKFGVGAGRQLKIQVYVDNKLQGTVTVNVQ